MEYPIHVLQVGMSPYYGGTEAFIMSQYRRIDREKVQFDFLNVFGEEIACEQEIQELGGKVYPLNMARHKGLKAYYQSMNLFFQEYAKQFQIIHCNLQSLINIDPLVYAKKYGIPVRIAHAHNSGYGKEPNWKQKLIIFKNQIALSSSANVYFACSDLAAHWMFHRDANIVNNAIDAEKYRFSEATRKRVRAEIGVRNEKVVITVGRLDPQKNPIFTIDIFAELLKLDSNCKLIIVGDGILREQVTNRIDKYAINDKVMLLGTRTDVPELLQAADVFVLPSMFEGLGIVLVEAQAAGLPCFASERVVPSQVNITGKVSFIPIDKGAPIWAEKIHKCQIEKRMDTYKTICSAGYDTKENALKLQNNYISYMENSV